MATYKIFTINSGSVEGGAAVGRLTLKGGGVEIPVIAVGETGRGRHKDVLAVHLPPDLYEKWKRKEEVRIFAGKVGKTRSGKWKIFAESQADSGEKIIAVMPTMIGFRGGNAHTGDRTEGVKKDPWGRECPVFSGFPGTVLAEGRIAQGTAGGMGSGTQLVAVLPKNMWFRTAYYGRLYGKPGSHYYKWDGKTLAAMTWDERQLVSASQDEEEVDWI